MRRVRFDPDKHHRRSIRLRGYDYSQAGAYFVTLRTQDSECLFGDIVDGSVRLNEAGQMVERWWGELTEKFPSVETDEHIVMPDHFHGIVIIVEVGAVLRDCPDNAKGHPHRGAPTLGGAPTSATTSPSGQPDVAAPVPTLSIVIHWFKTMTTNEYIRGVKERGWTHFPGRLWQRNYYEHIIRSQDDLDLIRRYIADNPLKTRAAT